MVISPHNTAVVWFNKYASHVENKTFCEIGHEDQIFIGMDGYRIWEN